MKGAGTAMMGIGTASGDNITVDPGTYTIVFDPATGGITY